MADGILCIYCGWYESDHLEGVSEPVHHGDPDKVRRGYRCSLNDCGDFVGNKRETKRFEAAERRRIASEGEVYENRERGEDAAHRFILTALRGINSNPLAH